MIPNPNPTEPKRIIVPAQYDVEIKIKYSSKTGQSEMSCNPPINNLAIAGILSVHSSNILRELLTQSAAQSGLVK